MRAPDTDLISWLVGEWSSRLVQTVESMTGERPAGRYKQTREYVPGEAAESERLLWWQQPLSLGPETPLWVAAPREAWMGLGMLTLKAAGIGDPEEVDARNTFLEILAQSLSGLAQDIGTKLARTVTCESGSEIAGPPKTCTLLDLELEIGGTPIPPLSIAFDEGLLSKITAVALRPGEEVAMATPQEEAPLPRQNRNALDLLLDVELPVSVSFGRAQLPLKDVLKLTSGSIVELNRTVAEPVEVIVNNCVIARGEVVVVEGNYGVRIREIISRQQRLRTLK